MIGKCANKDVCFNTNVPLFQFNTKYITDEEGLYYCHTCHKNKTEFEDNAIRKFIETYNTFTPKNPEDRIKLKNIIQYKYLDEFIPRQLIDEELKITRNGKTYILIEEDTYREIEIFLFTKKCSVDTLMTKRKQKIVKQMPKYCNEDQREQILIEEEERKKQMKEQTIKREIKRNKKKNKEKQERKDNIINYFKTTATLPNNFTNDDIKVIECSCKSCKGFESGGDKLRCYPFEFRYRLEQPERMKSIKGMVCDDCILEQEEKRRKGMVTCECGVKYFCPEGYESLRYIHSQSKHHLQWGEANKILRRKYKINNLPVFTTYNLKQLRKLCDLNKNDDGTPLFDNCLRMKKDETMNKLIELYAANKLRERCLDEPEDDDEYNDEPEYV